MISNYNNWKVGEPVNLKRRNSILYVNPFSSYEHFIASHYICVREADGYSPGILVKVLGKTTRDQIMIIAKEPFVVDDQDEGFNGDVYYGYRFPTLSELEKVLFIIRNNTELIEKFEMASMMIDPNSTFWVRETANRLLFLKELQCYDASSGNVFVSTNDNDAHCRLTIAYYYKSRISFF